MSYRCGLGPELAAVLGTDAGPPRLTCDGCGLRRPATKSNGMPYKWLLDNRKAPGWRLVKEGDMPRRDYCPACTPPKVTP